MSRELVCNPERMNVERIAAYTVVILGGVFWTAAAFSGPYAFRDTELTSAIGSALVPLGLTVAVFVLGRYSEIGAAALLYALSFSGLLWGAMVGWEPALWGLMLVVFVAPMLLAGVLYHLAWRMEAACGGRERALRMLDAGSAS